MADYVSNLVERAKVSWYWPLPNVCGLALRSETAEADARIGVHRILLKTPAAVRFLSCEPLLGRWICGRSIRAPILPYWIQKRKRAAANPLELTGVIVGGESGPGARPMHPDWARSIRDQRLAAGVPFFFKQWGEWEPVVPSAHPETVTMKLDGRCAGPGRRFWLPRRCSSGALPAASAEKPPATCLTALNTTESRHERRLQHRRPRVRKTGSRAGSRSSDLKGLSVRRGRRTV